MLRSTRFLEVVGMVDADMRAQIAGADKFPIADIAFVRFLPRVGENV